MPCEDIVLFLARTLRTLQTANDQHRYARCYQRGKQAAICHEPTSKPMHTLNLPTRILIKPDLDNVALT